MFKKNSVRSDTEGVHFLHFFPLSFHGHVAFSFTRRDSRV